MSNPHLSRAKTPSSNRKKAAHQAGCAKRKSKHAAKKNQMLNDNLLDINIPNYMPKFNPLKVDSSRLQEEAVFVDGGNKGNPSINPEHHGKKKLTILRINEGQLFVVNKHHKKKFVGRGVRFRQSNGDMVFTLCPRPMSLKAIGLVDDLTKGKKIVEAYKSSIDAAKSTLKRGKTIFINGDDDDVVKYICVGSAANRGKKGCTALHCVMQRMTTEHQRLIHDHIVAVEQNLYLRYLESSHIRHVIAGLKLSKAPLFTTTEEETTSIYQAFAVGKNVHLSTHVDKDFTLSAVTVIHPGKSDEIVAYFCFPTLGIAIPMRPFDVLFFDPSVPHNISSRCRKEEDIYCLSFYLKSNLIGGNDNSLPLTTEEEKYLDLYNDHHA